MNRLGGFEEAILRLAALPLLVEVVEVERLDRRRRAIAQGVQPG
jgi:hypothetical protein